MVGGVFGIVGVERVLPCDIGFFFSLFAKIGKWHVENFGNAVGVDQIVFGAHIVWRSEDDVVGDDSFGEHASFTVEDISSWGACILIDRCIIILFLDVIMIRKDL